MTQTFLSTPPGILKLVIYLINQLDTTKIKNGPQGIDLFLRCL